MGEFCLPACLEGPYSCPHPSFRPCLRRQMDAKGQKELLCPTLTG